MQYGRIWEFLRAELEMDARWSLLDMKLNLIQDNLKVPPYTCVCAWWRGGRSPVGGWAAGWSERLREKGGWTSCGGGANAGGRVLARRGAQAALNLLRLGEASVPLPTQALPAPCVQYFLEILQNRKSDALGERQPACLAATEQ